MPHWRFKKLISEKKEKALRKDKKSSQSQKDKTTDLVDKLTKGKTQNEDASNGNSNDNELPDIEDPAIQNATLAIQKAYKRKLAKAAQQNQEIKPSEKHVAKTTDDSSK